MLLDFTDVKKMKETSRALSENIEKLKNEFYEIMGLTQEEVDARGYKLNRVHTAKWSHILDTDFVKEYLKNFEKEDDNEEEEMDEGTTVEEASLEEPEAKPSEEFDAGDFIEPTVTEEIPDAEYIFADLIKMGEEKEAERARRKAESTKHEKPIAPDDTIDKASYVEVVGDVYERDEPESEEEFIKPDIMDEPLRPHYRSLDDTLASAVARTNRRMSDDVRRVNLSDPNVRVTVTSKPYAPNDDHGKKETTLPIEPPSRGVWTLPEHTDFEFEASVYDGLLADKRKREEEEANAARRRAHGYMRNWG